MDNENKTKDFQVRLSKKKIWLENNYLNYEDLLHFSALLLLEEEVNDIEIQGLKGLLDMQADIVKKSKYCIKEQKHIIDTLTITDDISKKVRDKKEQLQNAMDAYKRTKQAREAADILHSRPGGSREKQENIRKAWASGKYSSRDRCAEEESAALNMSFSTARKALRKTPDPPT